MEISKETAFNILQSRSLVAEPGKFTAKVTSANPFPRADGTQTTIVNFNLMSPYQADLAIKAFKAGDFAGAINNTSLTASQLSGQYVPSKGETVDVEVRNHVNKNGITMLVIDSIIERKAVQARKFTMVLEEEVVEAEADLV